MWLYENIESCKIMAMGTPMFMLLFIGTFLCLDLGSSVSLCYLWSLRDIDQIKNYDQGDMAYMTLLHFITQLSKRILSSLGGAPFVWQVCFGFFGYVWILESYFGQVVMVCVDFFGFGCMNILGLILKFGRKLMVSILDFSIGCPNTVY